MLPNGVEQFAWRPNGQDFAYVTSDEPENKKEIEKHNDAFEVGDNDFLATGPEMPSHLWLIAAEGGKPKRLTSGAWSLAKSAPPSSPASPINWSPDGKLLLFTRQEHPQFGDNDLSTVQVLTVDTGEIRKLTGHEKLEAFGLFSPDGSNIAYWYPREGDINQENEIFVTATAPAATAPPSRARSTTIYIRAIWMPDGNSLLVGGSRRDPDIALASTFGGSSQKTEPRRRLPTWLFWIDAFVGRKGDIAFTGISPRNLPSFITWLPQTMRRSALPISTATSPP